MYRFRTIRTIGSAAFCALMSFTSIVHADMWLSNFGGATPTIARRFRESDAGFVGLLDYGLEVTTGMQLGPDGRIYVAVNGLNQGKLSRFDAMTGAPLGELVPFGQNGYERPGDFVFGADGDVYAPSTQFTPGGTSGVLKFDGITGAFGGVFIAPGAGGMTFFGDIAVMPGTGDLLISDARQINRYNGQTGAFVGTFVAAGAGGTSFMHHLTYGPDGNLYASDFDHNQIRRFNGQTGAFVDVFVEADDLMSIIGGVAFGNDGNLYVSQRQLNDSAVRRYSGVDGSFIDTFIAHDPVYNMPEAIVFTPEPATMFGSVAMLTIATLRRRR